MTTTTTARASFPAQVPRSDDAKNTSLSLRLSYIDRACVWQAAKDRGEEVAA